MKDETRQGSILRRTLLAGGLLGMATTGLRAQQSPLTEPPNFLIVPFSSGGSQDAIARRFAEALKRTSNTVFRVENLPGAGGIVAVNQLVDRPRDGRTLLWGSSGLICNTPLLSRSSTIFNPVSDFAAVCTLIKIPFLLFASNDFPASDLAELKKKVTAKNTLTFSGGETGSANHIAGEVLLRNLGLNGLHVPYRQISQSVIDVAEGRVQLGISSWQNISPFLKDSRIKILSVLSDTHLPVARNLPTVSEQGFGNFDIEGWTGLFFAKGVSEKCILEYDTSVKSLLQNEDIISFVHALGCQITYRDHREAELFVIKDISKYKELLTKYSLI